MSTPEELYLLGIGGTGLGPLALYLARKGHQVSGEDQALKPVWRKLFEANGIRIQESDTPLLEVTEVIRSSAIADTHPRLSEARQAGIPVVRRGERLAREAAGHRLIAVVGSHGKTTTTAMLIHLLKAGGFPFSYVLGGMFATEELPPASYQENPYLLAELDESDGTIEAFSPEITVVTNFDHDHVDHYATEKQLETTFRELFQRTRIALFLPAGEANLLRLAQEAQVPVVITYGPHGDFSSDLELIERDRLLLRLSGRFVETTVHVSATGRFQAGNASAALAVAAYLGVEPRRDALAAFPGVARRQSLLRQEEPLAIYTDYAHHPAEINALLEHFRQTGKDERLVVVFQPHRYTRTARFKAAFARALGHVDTLFLLPVYPASEEPLPGGQSEDILALLDPKQVADLVAPQASLFPRLDASLQGPTVLLFLGAGDIEDLAHTYVEHRRGDPVLTTGTEVQTTTSPSGATLSGDPAWWRSLTHRLSPESVARLDEPLGRRTTFGVGGGARFYVEPAHEDDLRFVLEATCLHQLPFYFLGRGSNLIVPDEGYPGMVIHLTGEYWREVRMEGDLDLRAAAGVRLKQLCADACRLGLAGFEFLEGIPGTVGGSLRMNAGAMGSWIHDRVVEVRLITFEGDLQTLPASQIHADYRHCRELQEAIAVRALLRATKAREPADIRATMQEFARKRKASQPREPSAGCIFKNPPGDHAGRLIDELGLKGHRQGGAEVSPVHGNFIVNRGGATCADVLALIRDIRTKVKAERGIELEPEALLVGREWKEVLS